MEEEDDNQNLVVQFASVIDRYYTKHYYKQNDGEDLYFHMHTNKLVLFGLHPSHKALQQNIVSIEFNLEKQDNISGKRK